MKHESRRIIGLAIAAALLGGCAHKELTAPCDPLAVTASIGDDCGPEKPINVAALTGWTA